MYKIIFCSLSLSVHIYVSGALQKFFREYALDVCNFLFVQYIRALSSEEKKTGAIGWK